MSTSRFLWLALLAASAAPGASAAQPPRAAGPYARIAFLQPRDGQSGEFEAGYLRHLAWHQGAGDTWKWYGWSVWAAEHPRWFVYATFGHAAADFDHPVNPADDERDNAVNVSPYVTWGENGLYEFLPNLSRGSGEPSMTPRMEVTIVELRPDATAAFEAAVSKQTANVHRETLWYREVVGGARAPRYVRLRPMPGIESALQASGEDALPAGVLSSVLRVSREIWSYRPTMSLGLQEPSAPR